MLSNYQMRPVVLCDLLAPLPVHQGASGNRCVLEDISRSEEQMLCFRWKEMEMTGMLSRVTLMS